MICSYEIASVPEQRAAVGTPTLETTSMDQHTNRHHARRAQTRAWSVTVIMAAGMFFFMSSPGAAQQASGNAQVDRGRYLVTITGCHDCHSPKVKEMEPDLSRALSGRPSTTALPADTKSEVHASLDLTAWTGPWGYSVASN